MSIAPRSVVCLCRVRGALGELDVGVVVPVLLLLITSAAAHLGGARCAWASILTALVMVLFLVPARAVLCLGPIGAVEDGFRAALDVPD